MCAPNPFSPHLMLAHALWKGLLQPSDHVIDATCGNGQDTLVLAQLLYRGRVFAMDMQKRALERTAARVPGSLYPQVELLHVSHETFPSIVRSQEIKLIVYNLGYLPGGDKSLTTRAGTTLASFHEALHLISWRGAISITCYPGHAEGHLEEALLHNRALQLDPACWRVSHFHWTRRRLSPSLLWITRA